MDDETIEYRYLFTVRQQFGQDPALDCFYELQVPAGITADQAKVMSKLKEDWCKEEINEDTQALKGMQLRLRFNQDIYQKICLVRTSSQINYDVLSQIILNKSKEGKLMEFLEEAAIDV